MAQISGGGVGDGGSVDLSNYVTDDDPRLFPDKFDGLLDVAVGQTPARFDMRVWDEVNKVWFRIPYAVWSDATALGLAYNGGAGGAVLAIPTLAMNRGTDSAAYSSTVTATGGTTFAGGQYKWTLTGSLPSGITMAPTTGNKGVSAVFSGTMGAAAHAGGAGGVYAITVTATDALGATATLTTSITVVAAVSALAIGTVMIPDAVVGVDYVSDAIPNAVGGGTTFAGSETAGHQTTVHYHYTSSSLPNRKIRIDPNGTVTGKAGRLYSRTVAWGGVLDPPDSTVTGQTVQVTVTDAAAATVSQSPTMNIISANNGPSLALDDLIGVAGGAYTYTTIDAARPAIVTPSYNVAQINARAAQMAGLTPQGRLMSVHTGTIMIGAASGATVSTALIKGAGFNNWDLGGITFKLADTQPVNVASNNQLSCLFQLSGASAPKLNFTIDGNAANQWGGSGVPSVNKSTAGSGPDPIHGFYQFGVRLIDCGPATGTLVVKNVRGVTGNKSLNANGQTAVDETFFYQQFRYTPGDDIIIYCLADDGSDKTNTASGAVWQQSRVPNTSSTVLLVASGVRHGFGCYAGGTLVIDTGSIFTSCGRAIGVEAGTPNTAIGATETTRVTIGSASGATNGQIVTTGNDIAIGLIGNGRDSAHSFGRVDIYGWDSTSDDDGIATSGGCAPTGVGVGVNNARVYTPTGHALHYQYTAVNPLFAAWAAKTTLTGCHTSATPTGHIILPSYGLTTGTFTADL